MDEHPEAWVRPIKQVTVMSAIGTVSFEAVATAYVELDNVKIIRLIAKSGSSPKEIVILNKESGVKVGDGQSSDFMVNYKLKKDEDLDDINPFDVAMLAGDLDDMDDNLPEFVDKKTQETHSSDLPISLLEVEITDQRFVGMAGIKSPKLDLRFVTLKAENDDLKKDIYNKHRDSGLSHLFVHGFKACTLTCQMVIETIKRKFSEKEDEANSLIYWGGKDDLFPKTDYNLWLFIHNQYVVPRDFRIEKNLVLAGEDKLSLDGYVWG